MFLSRNKKKNSTPVHPSFTMKKWCFMGSTLYRHVFVMYSTYKNNDAQRRTALKRSVENYRSQVEWVGRNSPGVKFFPLKIDPFSEERQKTNLTNLPTLKVCAFTLALLLLNTTCPVLANSVDPDQLASEEAY